MYKVLINPIIQSKTPSIVTPTRDNIKSVMYDSGTPCTAKSQNSVKNKHNPSMDLDQHNYKAQNKI
jgi:hypothetical protein